MKRGNQDVVGEKCVLNDNEKLSFDTNAKNVAPNQLFNQEFDWDQSSLSVVHPVIGPALHVTVNMVEGTKKYQKIGRRAILSILKKEKVMHCIEGTIEVSCFLNICQNGLLR